MRVGLCEKYHWTWEESGQVPLRELDNFSAGFEAAYQREKKVAERKAWNSLTPEQQDRRLTIIRRIENMELGIAEEPHGG